MDAYSTEYSSLLGTLIQLLGLSGTQIRDLGLGHKSSPKFYNKVEVKLIYVTYIREGHHSLQP